MKKILFIHETMNGGGAEKVLCEILSNFDYNRFQVDLLLIYKKGTYLKDIDAKVNVLSIHNHGKSLIEKFLFHFKPLLNVLQKRKIRDIVKQRTYDTIISFMEGEAAKYHYFITDYALNNISWIHCDFSHNHWSAKYWNNVKEEAAFYQSLNKVFCVSKGAEFAIKKMFNLSGNLSILYNLIDWSTINEKAIRNDIKTNKFTICNVGRLVPPKRQDRIIEVARILKEKCLEVDFWILGTGILESELRDKAKKEEVTDIVHFLGFQNNPYPYMKAADLFLLTSDTEGYPLVICEALCLGKPIVSTNVTGVDELLAGGVGIVCDFNVEMITAEIEKLMKNNKLLSLYAALSDKKGREFDKETILNHIYSVL